MNASVMSVLAIIISVAGFCFTIWRYLEDRRFGTLQTLAQLQSLLSAATLSLSNLKYELLSQIESREGASNVDDAKLEAVKKLREFLMEFEDIDGMAAELRQILESEGETLGRKKLLRLTWRMQDILNRTDGIGFGLNQLEKIANRERSIGTPGT